MIAIRYVGSGSGESEDAQRGPCSHVCGTTLSHNKSQHIRVKGPVEFGVYKWGVAG